MHLPRQKMSGGKKIVFYASNHLSHFIGVSKGS